MKLGMKLGMCFTGLGSIQYWKIVKIQKIQPIPVSLSYRRYIFSHFNQVKKYLKYLKIQKIQPFCISVSYLRYISKVSSPNLATDTTVENLSSAFHFESGKFASFRDD